MKYLLITGGRSYPDRCLAAGLLVEEVQAR